MLCDGYAAYESLARANPQLKLAHCWAHARRELLPHEADPRARRALRVIQRLYVLEKRARDRPPDEILWSRQTKTKPLLEAFFRWIDSLAIPPTSELRNALPYIQLRKPSLLRFLGDPALDPDNNATERVIRGVVLGRKNHHGSRSERGTQVAALLYSLLDSAQLADINPHDYLRRAVHAALDGPDPAAARNSLTARRSHIDFREQGLRRVVTIELKTTAPSGTGRCGGLDPGFFYKLVGLTQTTVS